MTRYGRQSPTESHILPYTETSGPEAIKIYNLGSRTAQPWQEELIYDLMATNSDGLWVHMKYGYSLPRRNGKSEILLIREAHGLLIGEKIFHTAHRVPTAHASWERLCQLLSEIGLEEGEDYKTLKQYGMEEIRMLKSPADGVPPGVINFRTRTQGGGLGERADLLIIDEAQQYKVEQENNLQYVVSDSANPQIIMTGTPPTPTSAGTVFKTYRDSCLRGELEDCGWAEWSVPYKSDVNDIDLWYQCNPSMGYHLNERKVKMENKTDEVDFNIQRLGLWLQYNLRSAITRQEWEDVQAKTLPAIKSTRYVGIKYAKDGTNVCMAISSKTKDDKIFVEVIDCQNIRAGNKWIIDALQKISPDRIVIDGAAGRIEKDLKKAKIQGVIYPTVTEVITANSNFEQALYANTVIHMNQTSVTQAVTNCEKRAIGTNGGFGYRSMKDGVEIALLDSIILSHWAAQNAPDKKKKSQIRY